MKLSESVSSGKAAAISALLCAAFFIGLCDVHGPRWSYRTYTLFTPVACSGDLEAGIAHLEALGPILTPEHDPARLGHLSKRWLDTGVRREAEEPRPAGRYQLSDPPAPPTSPASHHHGARAPPGG